MRMEIYTGRTCTAFRVWYKMGPDTFTYFSYTDRVIHTHTHMHTCKNIHMVYALCICTHMHTQKQLTKKVRNSFNMCFNKVKK